MKKLIITANPSSKGFTHTIAEKYIQLSKKKWDETELLNLYTTELRQDFLTYEDKEDMWTDVTVKKIQAKISWADELVFIFPIWWWDAPAILKNFLDCNFTPGFAFKYVGWKWVWLLNGKSARIIVTSGVPSFVYKILFHIQFFWKLSRIGFCWLKQKSFTVFGNIDWTKTDKNKYLDEIKYLI